ncbi:hypothetical protein COV82_05180 [Candidatus Peregrinibacteria bacterium CG11_big_fil_rev_8_21_14_0_20_46_8]|nr:MAG: hypothetical protein COV82_05180 [Candidatus Peregrinibacteria bacterium CG11_big_fil_rev_8_21_14_0_20_46_8]
MFKRPSQIFFVFFLGIALVRIFFFQPENDLERLIGKRVEVSGRVHGGELEVREIYLWGSGHRVRGSVRIYLNEFESGDGPPILSGDTLRVRGVIKEGYSAPFISFPYIIEHTVPRFSFLRSAMQLQNFLVVRLQRLYPEPAASIVGAMLLGHRSTLAPELREIFQRAGVSHILAISGMHIVMVIALLQVLFARVSQRYRWLVIIGVLLFFVMLTGARASTTRAAIMGSLALIGEVAGRKVHGLRTLFLTAAGMLIVNPELIDDIGFQLSCGATGGILLCATRLSNWLQRIHMSNFLGLRLALSVSLAAQVATLPLILWHFGGVSLISPIANLAIVPLVGPIMMGGALSIFLQEIAAAPVVLLIRLLVFLAQFFASLPAAFIETGIS